MKVISLRIIFVFVIIGIFFSSECNGIYSENHDSESHSRTTLQSNATSQKTFLPVSVLNEGCCEGYTLLNTVFFGTVLIDMDGKIIHYWKSLDPQPAKMLPDGSLIMGIGEKIYGIACGDHSTLEQIAWNGTIMWSYHGWNNGSACQHHDFEREGNPVGYYAPGQDFIPHGKTLVLAHQQVINASISKKPLIDDVIYEVDWNGSLTGFEWHASEHFNQMGFDNTTKHGIYVNPGILGDGDWLHMNSMSLLGENKWYTMDPVKYACFNPQNIIVSSRNANFIAIISRETGDIAWKVGPDYSKDTEIDKELGQIIGQHHAHMIPKGLPGEGDILVFDNGGMAGYGYFGMPSQFRLWSRVIEFNPLNFTIVWQYSDIRSNWLTPCNGNYHRFFSFFASSVQRLPNGNTLITEGPNGRVLEVTNKSKIVWECDTPFVFHRLYRAYRIPPEWVPGNPSGYPFWGENATADLSPP